MNANDPLELLRRANARLGLFFARVSASDALGTQEELNMLLQLEEAVRSVEVLLQQGVQAIADREVRAELAVYRANLERLLRQLGAMQDSAVAQRDRLVARQSHLRGAQAWFAASQSTH